MEFDAIVLAGGTARRLGGVPKHSIVVDGHTLLDRALAAVDGARHVIVVGDQGLKPLVGSATVVREDPPLSGPAAGIAAGLAEVTADHVVVLACDYPFVAEALALLIDQAQRDGAIAVDASGRRQNLVFVVKTQRLREAVDAQQSTVNLSVHALLEPLDLAEVAVPPRSLHDIDTAQDLAEGSAP